MPTTTTTEGLIKPAPTDTFVAGVSFIGQSLDKIDNALAQRARLANPVFASSDTTKPTVISRAIANQSANLEEWQDTAGTALARVTNGGHVISQAGLFGGPASDSVVTGGTNVMRPGSTGAVGLVIRGTSGQTANLTEWQDSAGTVLARVNSTGIIVSEVRAAFGPGAAAAATNAGVTAMPPDAGNRGLVVRGAASQTANLTEWQQPDGTTRAHIRADGSFQHGSPGATILGSNNSGATFATQPFIPNQNGIIVRGAAGQTAPLIEVQNSAGDLMTSIDANGTYTTKAVVQMLPGNSGTRPLLVRGTLGQTANLTEWQNIAGTVMASVTRDGHYVGQAAAFGTAAFITNVDAQVHITNPRAGTAGIVVRGASGQTANMAEFQNSAGGVMAYVSNQGYIKVGGATTFVEHRGVLGGAVAGSVNSLHVNIDGTIYRIPFYS